MPLSERDVQLAGSLWRITSSLTACNFTLGEITLADQKQRPPRGSFTEGAKVTLLILICVSSSAQLGYCYRLSA